MARLRRLCQPDSAVTDARDRRTRTELLAVLKADAYGMGAVAFAQCLGREGVSAFGVGDSSEAIELRAAGIEGVVLILGAILEGEVARVVREGVSVCVHSESRVESLEAEARRQGRPAAVHLKVDTGMGRLGVLPSRALPLAWRIARSPHLEFEGVATHLAGVRCDDRGNERQLDRFHEVAATIRREGLGNPSFHAVASTGLFSSLPFRIEGARNWVRAGLALHGIAPVAAVRSADLRPVLSLRTQVIFLKDLPVRATVGYQRAHQLERPSRIATIPMGYNDGLPRRLSGRGRALVGGGIAPFVGAVSMDYATLDVTELPGVRVGDPVTLVGERGGRRISLPRFARAGDRIPHEALCALGRRVVRVHAGTRANAVGVGEVRSR